METEVPSEAALLRSSSVGSNSSKTLEDKLHEFDAVVDSISPNNKKAYLRAMKKCPHLVQIESKPLLFLRLHDFHVWNAVQTFLGYWEARLNVFGEERAFLPLNLTGKGALTEDDIQALNACHTALIPEHASGAPVIMCCPHNAPETSQDSIARTFFYIRNVAAMNPLAQAQGYFGLIRYSPTFKEMASSQGMRMGMATLEYIPIAIRHIVMLVKPDEVEEVRALMSQMAQQNPAFERLNVVAEDEELTQKLQAQGFVKEALPLCMGGYLDFDQIKYWLEKFKNGLDRDDYFISTRDNVAARLASKCPPVKGGTKAEWGIRVMEETLHFMAENEEKAAYIEALEVAPELVQSESNPLKFLQSVDYDGWAAARKICKYWFYRKKWFGRKAFRPMTVNGKGALSPDDFEMVQRGYLQILPHDTKGRPVMVLHSTGTPKGVSVIRALFYCLQKMFELDGTQVQGIVMLVHFVGEAGHIDGGKWTSAIDFIMHGTPLSVKNSKTYILAQEGSISMSRGQALKQVFWDPEVVELGNDQSENVNLLLKIGLALEGTPSEFGGRWTRKDFLAWLDRQLTIEESRDFTLYDDGFDLSLPGSIPSEIKTSPSDTTQEMTLLVAMEQALKNMSAEETGSLRAARREVPDLFAVESPPLRFLRAVDFDPLKAAKRLADYWARRCKLFGARAFLPLHLSENSALDRTAVRVIKRGEIALLPDDNSGRPVIFFSRDLDYGKTGLFDARLQAFFYLLQVASENPRSQTEGVVALRKWVPSLFSASRFSEIIEIGSTSLPVQFYSHHLICLVPPSGRRTYLESITSRIYSFSNHLMTGTTQVHLADKTGELRNELLEFDLRQECLPKSVGGNWDEIQDVQKWISERELREKNLAQRIFPKGFPSEKKCTEPVVSETSHSKEKALQAVEDAINMMADEEKADYLEAKSKVPHLVMKESNPLWFVRCEKWNTWAAARRVAFYWRKRKEIFGERAHLPMNQSGEGALSKEDVALLSTGYVCLLPRDSQGRDVVCHDASRKPPGMLERRLRVLFYIGNMLAENRKNQTEGSRFVVILSKISLDGGFSKTLEIAQEVLPSRNYDVHIVHVPGDSNKKTFMEKFVPPMLKILGSFLEGNTKVHVKETKSALLEELESLDFERSGLPSAIGGTWTYDQFYYWQEARIRMEWDLPLSTAQRKLVFEGDKYICRGLSELTDEEKVERKRRLNLLHSRRKREKEKVEVEVLKSQVSRLEDDKHEAETEGVRLQNLLNEAYALIGKAQCQQSSVLTESFSQRGSIGSGSYSGASVNRTVPSPVNYEKGIKAKRNAQTSETTSGVYYRSPPSTAAMNPQSPDAVRVQQMLLAGAAHHPQMQNMGVQHVPCLSGPSLGYLQSTAPAPGFASGAPFVSDSRFVPSMTTFNNNHQYQYMQAAARSTADDRNQISSHPMDTTSYAMRLDPNQAVKRQRYTH